MSTPTFDWTSLKHTSGLPETLPTNSVRPKLDLGIKISSQPRVNLPISFLTTNFKRAVGEISISTFLPPHITNSKWAGL